MLQESSLEEPAEDKGAKETLDHRHWLSSEIGFLGLRYMGGP
jgi:hypothetical protein